MADEQKQAEQKAAGDGQEKGGGGATPPTTYEEFLEQAPEPVKALVTGRISKLEQTLDTVRAERKDAEKRLREAAGKLEKDSEGRKALEEQLGNYKSMEKRSAFYETALAAGCRNLRLAFLAGSDAGLIREDGSADFAAMKERYPELFGDADAAKKAVAGKGNAGDGQGKKPPEKLSLDQVVNRALRVAAVGPAE